ncbi:MAG TPA: hypothetical protein VFC18_22450 [Burkholderiales bacterium]|nr:hypothetical protein [Burkholderiales bacterium]
MIRVAIVAVGLLAGCSVTVAVSSGAATAMAVGLTSVVIVGEELRTERVPPPELAPDRVVAEQDCTRPIDETAGNLRCK